MRSWKTVSRRTLLDRGRYLRVEEHEVVLPDGRVIPDWTWVVTPDFVIVVAVAADGKFLCFRQTKYAVEGVTLAPIGGYIDPGELPMSAAERELREETGYQATRWVSLGSFPVDGNRGAGTGHLFLATGAVRVSEPHSDDLEEQELVSLSRREIGDALDEGAFKALPWVAAVALALRAA